MPTRTHLGHPTQLGHSDDRSLWRSCRNSGRGCVTCLRGLGDARPIEVRGAPHRHALPIGTLSPHTSPAHVGRCCSSGRGCVSVTPDVARLETLCYDTQRNTRFGSFGVAEKDESRARRPTTPAPILSLLDGGRHAALGSALSVSQKKMSPEPADPPRQRRF